MVMTYNMTKEQLDDYIKDKRGKVTLSCTRCSIEFSINASTVKKALKIGRKNLYCSHECSNDSKRKPITSISCPICSITFTPKDRRQTYCSRSCAASYNNRVSPKRLTSTTKDKVCKCGNKMDYRSSQCLECKTTFDVEKHLAMTIGHFKSLQRNNSWHHFSTGVRKISRNIAALRGMKKTCKVCDYDTYVELCHIKAISSFKDTSTMGEVNSEDNLVYLCPNHHKELDLGYISLE